MAKVYFKKMSDMDNKQLIDNTVYAMISKLVEENNIELEETVPLKVHFGEKGNDTFITPNNYEGARRYLRDNNIKSCYMDTNVLYKGSRTRTKDHIETAKSHGFTDLDIVIADGDDENQYEEIEVNLKHYDKCKIGTKYRDYNNYIVLCHFKGHISAGIGAAIKQLAMGFASRGGKLHQHANSVPVITESKCIECQACVKKCPANAIYMDNKAKINAKKCIGCAQCTTTCPKDAITNNFDSTDFPEKLAEYAYAASKGKKNIYISFAFNITKLCDCFGEHQDPVAPNIGIFASIDPVAIDRAALDKVQEIKKEKIFNTADKTLKYAEQIGLGTNKYQLINMD